MDYKQSLENTAAISQAIENKQFEIAKKIIFNQLEEVKKNNRDWNTDNIIHTSFTYLGLIALEENQPEKAKDYLMKSIEIKGSPQIKSFGSNMKLADKLLRKGESILVLEYLERSRKIMTFLTRFGKIRKWKKAIINGGYPDFKSNMFTI